MDKKQQAIQALRNIVTGDVITFVATVTEVSAADASCTVETVEGLTFYDVRLRSLVDGSTGGMVVYPTVGSWVIVGRLGKSNQLFVIKTADADYFTLKSQNESLKQILSDLLDGISQLTVTTGTGPSGVPINISVFTQLKQRLNNLLKE